MRKKRIEKHLPDVHLDIIFPLIIYIIVGILPCVVWAVG